IDPLLSGGAPGVSLNQDGTFYFDLHHTPDDTLDKIDREQLRQNVAAWTTMLAVLSGGIEPEPKRRPRR
ncbi:MAG: peptidase M28 family protein, partial [Sphingomicrobium sp.]